MHDVATVGRIHEAARRDAGAPMGGVEVWWWFACADPADPRAGSDPSSVVLTGGDPTVAGATGGCPSTAEEVAAALLGSYLVAALLLPSRITWDYSQTTLGIEAAPTGVSLAPLAVDGVTLVLGSAWATLGVSVEVALWDGTDELAADLWAGRVTDAR
jgi:hypothetical protein